MARIVLWAKRCLLMLLLVILMALLAVILVLGSRNSSRRTSDSSNTAHQTRTETFWNRDRVVTEAGVGYHPQHYTTSLGKDGNVTDDSHKVVNEGADSGSSLQYVASEPSKLMPNSCLAHNVTAKTAKRYVLGWLYFEQLTMATTNLFSLMWYTKWWNASVVMPYSYSSRMYGLCSHSHCSGRDQLHPIDLLYDLYSLTELACNFSLPLMVNLQEFLSTASRQTVVVHFIYNNDDLAYFSSVGGSRSELIGALHNQHMIDCSGIEYISKITTLLESNLNRMSRLSGNKPFDFHRRLCVNASLPNEPSDLLRLIGLHNSDEFSVIFTHWRGLSSSASPKKAVQGVLKNFRLLVPSSHHTYWPHPAHVVFPISTHVRGNATKFIKTATSGQKFTAVHFRSEKLGQAQARIPTFINDCFQKAVVLLKRLSLEHENLVPLFFTDYGAYGSNTCHNSCRGAKKLDSLLSAKSIQVTHFSPSDFGAVADSGFVALVEQEVVASSHTLLLVGGGSFQTQVHKRFKKYNRKGAVYRICWDDSASVKRM